MMNKHKQQIRSLKNESIYLRGKDFLKVIIMIVISFTESVGYGKNASKNVYLEGLCPRPSVTVYISNNEENSTARLYIKTTANIEEERLMIRSFDPDERLSSWCYLVSGADIAGKKITDINIPLKEIGIHQIRITSGEKKSSVSLELPVSAGYGVSFQNGAFTPWDNMLHEFSVYIPERAEELQIKGGPLKLFDDTDRIIFDIDKNNNTVKKHKINETKTVYKLMLPDKFNFHASGFPFILCDNKQTALAIKASVEILEDGTVVNWKFQKQIHALLPWLLSENNIGKTESLLYDLIKKEEELKRTPIRNQLLVNRFDGLLTSIDPLLRSQNLDIKSNWSGTFDSWQDRETRNFPENKSDRLNSVNGLFAGTSSRKISAAAEKMASAALFDHPANPYYGKRELLFRAAAACLRDLMTLGEDETWRGVNADLDPYNGYMAFPLAQKTLPAFALTAPEMPVKVREVWTQGLRHIIDRLYPEGMVSCRNQSSHYLLIYEYFAIGSGLTRYKELSREYAKRFATGAHKAGFFVESSGPDASYTGITHWHLGMYYSLTKDPVIKDALKKSYNFFNHTVAPEPDGKIIGGTNFNHRVVDGFDKEQWHGARGLVDSHIAEVGLWQTPRNRHARIQACKEISESLQALPVHLDECKWLAQYNFSFPRFINFSNLKKTDSLPALSSSAFIRNLDDEMIAIREKNYYTVIYVGHPAQNSYSVRNYKLRKKLTDNAESSGGEVHRRNVVPFLGGGMTLLWTPDYGSAILSTCWSPLTHHGLIAVNSQEERFWEDYFKNSFHLDEKNRTLTISGTVENFPLNYKRI
ncbi:MAG: hypothetical protein JXR78_19375, partial [Victivallales bacterium]|nr:hypothetical protein [Victivallales bacterium]